MRGGKFEFDNLRDECLQAAMCMKKEWKSRMRITCGISALVPGMCSVVSGFKNWVTWAIKEKAPTAFQHLPWQPPTLNCRLTISTCSSDWYPEWNTSQGKPIWPALPERGLASSLHPSVSKASLPETQAKITAPILGSPLHGQKPILWALAFKIYSESDHFHKHSLLHFCPKHEHTLGFTHWECFVFFSALQCPLSLS